MCISTTYQTNFQNWNYCTEQSNYVIVSPTPLVIGHPTLIDHYLLFISLTFLMLMRPLSIFVSLKCNNEFGVSHFTNSYFMANSTIRFSSHACSLNDRLLVTYIKMIFWLFLCIISVMWSLLLQSKLFVGKTLNSVGLLQ